MSWTLKNEHRSGGLLETMPELDTSVIVEMFGPPWRDAYYDPEAGYDGEEWTFVNEKNEAICVYVRFGVPRLGGNSVEAAEEFKSWLKTEIKAW